MKAKEKETKKTNIEIKSIAYYVVLYSCIIQKSISLINTDFFSMIWVWKDYVDGLLFASYSKNCSDT
jgi:hypothetical protein